MNKILSLLILFSAFSCPARDLLSVLHSNSRWTQNFPFPSSVKPFTSAAKAAMDGDKDAQKELYPFIADHFDELYKQIERQDSTFFGMRKVKKDFYSDARYNYVINLEAFFKKTTDKVRIKKKSFKVTTTEGDEYLIGSLKYDAETDELTVKKPGSKVTEKIPLSSLIQKDKDFVQSALIDNAFDKELNITSEENLTKGVAEDKQDYSHTTFDEMERTLFIGNKGDRAIQNILIEYQTYIEQSLMGISRDIPTDYRVVGYFKIDELAPGRRIEHKLKLPRVRQTKAVTRHGEGHDGDGEYYVDLPKNSNPSGKGEINGTWVKAYRITPYGERLEIDYKSSGVGSKKWEAVVPLYAKFD